MAILENPLVSARLFSKIFLSGATIRDCDNQIVENINKPKVTRLILIGACGEERHSGLTRKRSHPGDSIRCSTQARFSGTSVRERVSRRVSRLTGLVRN